MDDHSPAVLDPASSNTGGQRGKVLSPRHLAIPEGRRVPTWTEHTHICIVPSSSTICPCKWGGWERRDVVGGKCRAAIYLTLGRNRLVPLSLCIQTRSQRVHIMQPTLCFTHPLPLPPPPTPKTTKHTKKRSDARRCGHPPTGEETKIAWTCFVTVQAAVK